MILKVQFFPGLATKDTMTFLVTPPSPAGIQGSSFHKQLLRTQIYANLFGKPTYGAQRRKVWSSFQLCIISKVGCSFVDETDCAKLSSQLFALLKLTTDSLDLALIFFSLVENFALKTFVAHLKPWKFLIKAEKKIFKYHTFSTL